MRRNQEALSTPGSRSSGRTNSTTPAPSPRSPSLTLRVTAFVVAAGSVIAAFDVGAHAGAALNGRVMAISVAQVPMLLVASPGGSAVHTHVR